jgi:hypothetical protein
MNKKRSHRSQRFYRWSPPLFVPTKTTKTPNFTLRNREKSGRAYIATLLSFHHIQDNIKKETQKWQAKTKTE